MELIPTICFNIYLYVCLFIGRSHIGPTPQADAPSTWTCPVAWEPLPWELLYWQTGGQPFIERFSCLMTFLYLIMNLYLYKDKKVFQQDAYRSRCNKDEQ